MSGSHHLRRLVAGAAALAVVTALPACSKRSDALGAGDNINWCYAYFILDSFREPKPDDKAEVLQYAEASIRVIDRVDQRFELRAKEELKLPNGHMPKVSPEAIEDHATMRAAFVRLRDQVKVAPGDGDAVRAATNAFAQDTSYSAAERRATDYFVNTCARD